MGEVPSCRLSSSPYVVVNFDTKLPLDLHGRVGLQEDPVTPLCHAGGKKRAYQDFVAKRKATVNWFKNVDFVWAPERSKYFKLILLTPRDAQNTQVRDHPHQLFSWCGLPKCVLPARLCDLGVACATVKFALIEAVKLCTIHTG